MFFQYDTDSQEQPTAEEESQFWAQQLATYLAPYHERLDAYLDRRVPTRCATRFQQASGEVKSGSRWRAGHFVSY